MAIVVVVSLVALLTLLVLAFLISSSTNRNTTNIDVSIRQAESIASAATEVLISDIYTEFAADTPPVDASPSDKTQKIYQVESPFSMIPSRSLKSPGMATDPAMKENFRNLIKQSADGMPFATITKNSVPSEAGPARASSVSTITPGTEGRYISKESWSAPALFANDSTLAEDQVPDWVYIDRNGDNPGSGGEEPAPGAAKSLNTDGTPNPKFIVGRYAWQMYDLGGLLDANVALHDPSDTALGKDAKDSPFWAVATALPGASAALGTTLSKWRHPVGKTAAAKPKRLIEDWAEPNGWNKVFSDGSKTDQTFLTRSDLIRFQQQHPTEFPKDLLAMFTHSNHSLNQAAIHPDPTRPKVLAIASGGNDGTSLDDQINPSFLEIRAKIPEWTSPRRPTVPVAARRFPLDRLELVVPSPAEAGLVSRFFGLSYSGGEWTYSGNSIKRLPDVAALNREPDLFELLKATIHLGSIGVAGVGDAVNKGRDQSVNYHIVQLVANLIDQWDEDSFPTIINFDDRQFVGIEDLPRIYYVRTICYRQKVIPPSTFAGSPAGSPPPGHGTIYESVYLRQPVIWNPHAESPASSKPTEFRAIAISNQAAGSTAADVKCQVYNGSNGVAPWKALPTGAMSDFKKANGPDFSVNPGPQKWDQNSAFITFGTTTSGPASFRQPYPLKSPNYPVGSNAAGKEIFPISDPPLNFPDAASNQAIGFLVGKIWTASNQFTLDPGYVVDNGIRYELQYKKGADWITYDVMITNPFTGQDRVSFSLPDRRHFASFFRIDPRTSRLGIFSTNNFRGWPVKTPLNEWSWKNAETAAPDTAVGNFIGKPTPPPGWQLAGGNAVLPRNFQANLPNNNGAYIDADGIIRPAMGADASGVIGLPLANPPSSGDAFSRPRILNRPFRSIAELGYVFRDLPWRQFDLNHAKSEDGKLLDIFCLHSDEDHQAPRVSRGRINLNSAPPQVLAALIQATSKAVEGATPFTDAEAFSLGKGLNDWVTSTTTNGIPLRQRSDLVGSSVNGKSASFMGQIDSLLAAGDKPIEERREALIRALADSSDTRTWNLMIDIVAQSGELQRGSSSLEKFISRAQVRHWVFLSIDRFTGEILHRSSEPVVQ